MTAPRAGADYDALLIVSFGGPEGPNDVRPFLDKVFRGLRVSEDTIAHVAQRYEQFGGVSPINAQTRAFIKALQQKLDALKSVERNLLERDRRPPPVPKAPPPPAK